MKTIIIAGTHSGTGKTTVSMGIMAALARRGLTVQPFKVGPDFIDPTHHTAITGRYSRNLDTYLMGADGVRASFSKAARGADVAVIEGVMGLFDGLGVGEEGSTAQVAKILGAPVVLVIDARGMSRSAGAVARGFREFDPGVKVCGVIANRTGSERHASNIRDNINDSQDIPFFGALPKATRFQIPGRHLGLHMAHEENYDISGLADMAEASINIDGTLESAADVDISNPQEDDAEPSCTVGVALDSAFCFYYYDTFDAMRSLGARLLFFSPMHDRVPDVDGIYMGGGYPELHAGALEAGPARERIKKLSGNSLPVYGECGALLYLAGSLETDREYKMCGALDSSSRMTPTLQALGYTEAAASNCIMAAGGTRIRGHEFHYSLTECASDSRFAYVMNRGKGIEDGKDGLTAHNTLASYMHTHPAAMSFDRFVAACRAYRKK
ncbi:MAG TPA: cobyrinate a,c-diamide synthase [Candidatus Methanoperedenaceae archaeon]|nr:cobyrinate a,c-diamide synthase [Candidatus Methanoperedenaceae archaeon]